MRFPKVHLHCHLEGTLRAATFIELAEKHGVSTTYHPKGGGPLPTEAVDDVYKFSNFQEFLFTFAAVSRSIKDPDDYGRLAREFAEDALEQGVIYGELFISPSVWQFFHPDLDVRACVQSIRGGLDEVTRRTQTEFALIVDLTRNFGAESAMRTAQLATSLTDLGVIGIGLGGDEARFPPELYVEQFSYARANGLHTVAHAGEAAGPQSVRDAVELLGVERIGHGVRALEDSSVVELLASKRIPLEICPTSNFLTGCAKRDQLHPLFELDEAGCIVTIDADDPTLFGTSISEEYAWVASQAGEEALARFVGNAIDASFATAERKAKMRERLSATRAELDPQVRSYTQ